jgi:hypothetical protein
MRWEDYVAGIFTGFCFIQRCFFGCLFYSVSSESVSVLYGEEYTGQGQGLLYFSPLKFIEDPNKESVTEPK